MEAGEDYSEFGSEAKTIKYYYSKRNELVPPISLTSPPIDRQMLSLADSTHVFSCNELFEVGSFYEIDHEKLPPKSPIQLKAIRIVMVSQATMLDVTVNFPSTLALRSYFSCSNDKMPANCFPELDERFVMSSNQAGKILRRRIPPAHLEAGKGLKSFWLMASTSPGAHELPLIGSEREECDTKPAISMGASCLLSLKCAEVVGWGIRKKIKYIGRHCMSASPVEEKLDESSSGRKRARKISSTKNNEKMKMKKKEKKVDGREPKKIKSDIASFEERSLPRGTKDRWSTERYEAAEKRLLEIMREKKAGLGTPVLRQALREEARKHIGDTGLLDHLLKHMAGKVVSDGKERFRRRHNSEGAMEYWLEPAEFMEIRRKAGVNDSFWIPPPGWKPGDSLFPSSCSSDCNDTIAELKQQLAVQFARFDEQQNSLKKLEKDVREMKLESDKAIAAWQSAQEKCQILLEQKSKHEEDITVLFDCIRELKEEVHLLKEKKQKPEKAEPYSASENLMRSQISDGYVTHAAKIGNEFSGVSTVGGKKAAARRSGFKICKPQGTFLWPSMASMPRLISSSSMSMSPRAQGIMVPAAAVRITSTSEVEQLQQQLMVFPAGGPPSASSSTASTAPKLQILPATGPESEVMAVPQLVQPQRTVSSENLCASQYNGPEPCLSASAKCISTREGGGEWNADDALGAAGSPWKPLCWAAIATDLALATPSFL